MSLQPLSRTLPDLLQEMADRYADREAIVDGKCRITYGQLHRDVNDFAGGLRSIGIGRHDSVAVMMGNRAEWIVSALAATSLGAVAVAVNTWWTPREIAYALDHAEARVVVCTPSYMKHDYVQTLEDLRAQARLPKLERIVGIGQSLPGGWLAWDDLRLAGSRAPANAERAPVESDDVAFILYTSGSTSHPKGVQLVHRGLIENLWNIGERQGVTEQDRLWLAVSLFWGFGCSNAMLNLLTHGGCIVLQESFDAAEALRLIETERCTLIYGTPNMIQALAEHPDRERHDLSSLRSGAALGSPEQMRRAITLGAHEICNVYGLSEVYGNSHVTRFDDPLDLRLRSCGKPLPGLTQKIVDPETGAALAAGEVGEIRVMGHVTPGYLKDEEQTALAFDEDGFFKTGDLGTIDDDGNLYFCGRLKELVKTGGINVSPAEIEAVLMSHPQIHLAVVTGVPHPSRDEVLAAVVVARSGCRPSDDELRAFCRQQLAAYKVPSLIRFVEEEALPLTTTGKVQKNQLARTFFASEQVPG